MPRRVERLERPVTTTVPDRPAEPPAGPAAGSDREPVDGLLREVAQLREAVETRDVIGQAKGILMVGFRCDAETAFGILCRLSQNTNRKVRDVALLVVSTVVEDRPLPEDLKAVLSAERPGRARA